MSAKYFNEDALKATLATASGRQTIRDLLGVSGLFHQPFSLDSQRTTDFNCGRLNSGLILYAACNETSPDLTAIMMKEEGYDNREQQRVADAANAGDGLRSDDSGDFDPSLGFDRFGLRGGLAGDSGDF